MRWPGRRKLSANCRRRFARGPGPNMDIGQPPQRRRRRLTLRPRHRRRCASVPPDDPRAHPVSGKTVPLRSRRCDKSQEIGRKQLGKTPIVACTLLDGTSARGRALNTHDKLQGTTIAKTGGRFGDRRADRLVSLWVFLTIPKLSLRPGVSLTAASCRCSRSPSGRLRMFPCLPSGIRTKAAAGSPRTFPTSSWSLRTGS